MLWYRGEGGKVGVGVEDQKPFYVFNSDQETDWVRGDQQGWRHQIKKNVFYLGPASLMFLLGEKK